MQQDHLGAAVTPAEQLAFIQRVAPWAQYSHAKYGVPASVTIAQAILESSDRQGNWGKSTLAAKYNNFFGIKDSRLFGDGYCELKTTEYVKLRPVEITARFESFKDPQRSFEAHAQLLAQSPRYEAAMADADDPFVFAARIRECGYSTDPDYAHKLASLITKFHLRDFDAPAKPASQKA